MNGAALDEHSRRWSEFSRDIIGVLSGTFLAALLIVAGVTAFQMGGLAKQEAQRRAQNLARFMARTAFVPVSLEDRATLARAASVYLDDPDLVHIDVFDARGATLLSLSGPSDARRGTVSATVDVVAPAELNAPASGPAIGRVRVVLGLRRVLGTVAAAFGWIAGACLLLLSLAIGLDVTLIARMTARLRELLGEASLARELQRSNQELQDFAYVASHDLQAPLRRIVSYSQLLQRRYRGKVDADSDRFLDVIIDSGTRMRQLIQDLLAFSRVGTQAKPLVPVETAEPLRQALATYQEPIAALGARVEVGPLPAVLADPLQLQELFENLLSNALKFRADRPTVVEIGAERQGAAAWLFHVRDNGLGFEPAYAESIFEMFKRLHSDERFAGTGIGLAICKKIVERHGGKIWASSAPGEGATFFFTLQAAPEARA